MRQLPENVPNENLLVGNETSDDAGVYKLTDHLAIIQTLDFFTPIVDDPYMFGQIAAANALSDVYAMGGKPITAMNIVGFPIKKLGSEILVEILKGAADKVKEAGAITVGGHSIEDQEPKFGLSVTGTVHPDRIWKNVGSEVGDVLVLTKPIGVGIISTGIKRGLVSEELEKLVEVTMATLNREAAEAAHDLSPSAVTDITGFGLLGHAYEMAYGSKVSMRIHSNKVPLLPDTMRLAELGSIPGGSKSNYNWLKDGLQFSDEISENEKFVLCDAITSGGLLLSMKPNEATEYCKRIPTATVIGEVVPKECATIIIDKI
ncbi:MAG: selD [Bacillales bacterium]|nr:selD [Bacillales bacterium]